ncbi:hypothetical protein GOBAR_AA23254 [Gossypium barbadense]|uniref:Drought induced 19 protein type zinc-binding domain-containing protein n=1 Tax=Gossypium barbadense TaxID=3634 RepID=A0A2P5X254_GOSBA|nr:hypothetical protein GOBAR_AA23254 [Gossypium barbadense]
MDADSWSTRLSSVSKRYQFTLQSRSDMFMGFEEIDGEDDIREEFPSPFCSEHFDILSLCCHIDDEHPMEAKNGVCPVCAMKVEVDMNLIVGYVSYQQTLSSLFFPILKHLNQYARWLRCPSLPLDWWCTFRIHKRKSRKGGSHSMLSRLRKELREGNLQSLFGGSCILSSSNSAPDPLLSSFILPMVDDFVSVQPHFSSETSATEKSSDIKKLER